MHIIVEAVYLCANIFDTSHSTMEQVFENLQDLLAARRVEREGEHLLEMLHVGLQELIERYLSRSWTEQRIRGPLSDMLAPAPSATEGMAHWLPLDEQEFVGKVPRLFACCWLQDWVSLVDRRRQS